MTTIDFQSRLGIDHFTDSLLEGITFSQLRSLKLSYGLGPQDDPDYLGDVEPLAVTGFWQYVGHLLKHNNFPALEDLTINACTISVTVLLDMVFAVWKLPTLTTLDLELYRIGDHDCLSDASVLETDAAWCV